MGKMIDTLLALARADAGAETMGLEVFDLNDLVADAAKTWASQSQKAAITFQADGTPGPALIFGDRAALRRLVDILADNAWKYTPRGGTISLTVFRHEETATVTVADNGVGISEDDLPRIFDRFYSSGTPQNGNNRGSGLGLALALWIAQRHQMTIDVASEVGRGSRFSFSCACVGTDYSQGRAAASRVSVGHR